MLVSATACCAGDARASMLIRSRDSDSKPASTSPDGRNGYGPKP